MNFKGQWIAAALFGAFALAGSVRAEDPPAFAGDKKGTIKIVSSLPRTGSSKGQTDTIVNGIKLALEEAGNKVGDFKIEYEDLDDATATSGSWDAQQETNNANKAIGDKDVMVYIGTYNSGASKISMPLLNKANVLMISPANTAPGLTKPKTGAPNEPECYRPSGKVNYFRVVPTDDIQGPVGAAWAKKLTGKLKKPRSVYILHDGEVYGEGVAKAFKQECEALKLEVLGYEPIDVKAQEFKALMLKVKAKNPGLIYFGGTSQTKAGQIVKDMAAAGIDAPYMVPDGCFEQAFIDSAGSDIVNGRCYVTFGGMPISELGKTDNGKAFIESYQKKFGKLPEEAYSAYGYECAKVALECIRRAGVKNREALLWHCARIKDYDGVLGKWSFDKNGDTSLQVMSGNIIEGGKFKFSQKLELSDE
ncbi:MAG: branched-chain amino acid ABC transporter substrate-binding protein [Planctomycetes bacterium]|nr:branched-chain amino acid ABC transporter substrate-binding protein [Planctomycetota bacterium]